MLDKLASEGGHIAVLSGFLLIGIVLVVLHVPYGDKLADGMGAALLYSMRARSQG